MRTLAVCTLAALAVALAATSASARHRTRAAVFNVTFSATIAESATFELTETRDGCRYRTAGSGSRRVTLVSTRPSRLTVVRTRGGGLRTYSRIVVRGSVRDTSGSAMSTPEDCEDGPTTHADCFGTTRQVRGAIARFLILRNGAIVFSRMRNPDLVGDLQLCGLDSATPVGGVEYTRGRLSGHVHVSDLFDRRTTEIAVRAESIRTGPLRAPDLETSFRQTRVRWTLRFKRVR